MNHSVKRLRQTTLFENFVRSKRGKTLDLMETEVKTKTELRDILATAAEKRIVDHIVDKKEPEVVPKNTNSESCCSTSKPLDSGFEDFSLSLSQTSDDLFPEECCSGGTTSNNCDDMKAKRTFSWEQVPEVQLKRLPECCPLLPTLKPSETHTVMFKLPIQNGVCPEPSPHSYRDAWDSLHVKMPCSPESKCPVLQNGEKVIESRWNLIEKSLLQDMTSSYDIQEAILQYNSQYANRWNFHGLHAFFKDVLKPEEKERFFHHTLPAMVRLALQLPHLCTQPIPLLGQQSNRAITFTQKQIACLLSNAFFCTFPRRNISHKRNEQKFDSEYSNYPDINFNRLFQGRGSPNSILSRKAEKLKCLINYFARVTSEEPTGTVTFHRQCLQNVPKWTSSQQVIRKAVIDAYGVIEEDGYGMLQVDFANKLVGGGVLGAGSVQEEIRFVICPELIISRLFTECLGVSDVLLISGVEQFNKYSGYSDSFIWDGDFRDQTPRDSWGRRCTKIVAMDAINYRKPVNQYRVAFMQRELNKAYCGFHESDIPSDKSPAIATGNWGCGVYKGSPHLKFLIQLTAASENGRDMMYFTFRNSTLEKELKHMYALISSRNVKVGDIWALLCNYSETVLRRSLKTDPPTLYDFFCRIFSAQNVGDRSPQVSVSCGSSSPKSYENSDASTEELTDIEPTSRKEPG